MGHGASPSIRPEAQHSLPPVMPGRRSGDGANIRRRDLKRELIRARWFTCIGSKAAKKPGAGRNRPTGISKLGPLHESGTNLIVGTWSTTTQRVLSASAWTPNVHTYPDQGPQARTPRRSASRQQIERVTCPSASHSAGLPGGYFRTMPISGRIERKIAPIRGP